MASNKIVTLGPVAFATSVGILFQPPDTFTNAGTNPPEASTNTYYIIRHIRIINTSSSNQTFNIYKEASAAGSAAKAIVGVGTSVAANSAVDWFGMIRVASNDTTKAITGFASATTVTIVAEAEMGIV